MHLAILSGPDGWHARDLLRAAAALNHTATAVDFRTLSAGVTPDQNPLQAFDAVIVRTMPHGSLEQVVFRMDLLHRAEVRGVTVVNPPRALEVCIDKYLCSARLSAAGLTVPRTITCQDAETALQAFHTLGGNTVVKPLFGSEGRGMLRVEDPEMAWRCFRTLERIGAVIYVQEFIHHPGWDLRLMVLQGRVVAGMRRIGRGDWRTNVAQGATAEPYTPSPMECDVALRAATAVGTSIAGVDLLYDLTGTLYVIEVNAVPGWRTLAPTTGIDIAREIIHSISTGAAVSPRESLIGTHVQQACLWEATARKVGNVHPEKSFVDLTYRDFVLSAAAIAPILHEAPRRSLGETVFRAIEATQTTVRSNTNLGIVLLLAPLAAGERHTLAERLAQLTVQDSRDVYRAIRRAQPGGLGQVREGDVAEEPTQPLLALMTLARDRDAIALEYTRAFDGIYDFGVPMLLEGLARLHCIEGAILFCQLSWLQRQGDSLVRRKRGDAEDTEMRHRAAHILERGLETSAGRAALTELDGWLRAVGNGRNPGTTADLITACLFVALQQRRLTGLEPFTWTAWAGSCYAD